MPQIQRFTRERRRTGKRAPKIPKVTLYIRERDRSVWSQAERYMLHGNGKGKHDSLSRLVVAALSEYLRRYDSGQYDNEVASS